MTDGRLETLSPETCLRLLREGTVGRIAFVVDDDPLILPVNYRLVEPSSGPLLAVRTQPGTAIDQAPSSVAFEIDSIDVVHHGGWSVLVRGELLHTTPTSPEFRELYDPKSWLSDRESWLLVNPWAITGRELHGADAVWPFHLAGYL
jgi:nitroimidazol reductase NimA-like FMN-containing flavoprotein (pyridoxamine 5'-phosphate oxidase superfamily)